MKRMQILTTLAIGAVIGIAAYTTFIAIAQQPGNRSEIVVTHRFDTSDCTMTPLSSRMGEAFEEGIEGGIPITGLVVNCDPEGPN